MSLTKKIRLLLLAPLLATCVRSYLSGGNQPDLNRALVGTMVAQTLTAYPPAYTNPAPHQILCKPSRRISRHCPHAAEC